jgi:putative flippase GtrA
MFPRFLIVGTLGFLVDAGGTYLLIGLGLHALAARPPATALAILATWLANRRFTFRVDEQRTWGELLRYAAVALATAAFNVGAYSVFVLWGWLPLLAIVVASVLQMGLSFVGYRYFAFGRAAGRDAPT